MVQRTEFEATKSAAGKSLALELQYVGTKIANSKSKYLCGDNATLCDIVVATYVVGAKGLLDNVALDAKVEAWIEATMSQVGKGPNDYSKDSKAFSKSESSITPQPIRVGLENHVGNVFTKALHAAFPILKTVQPISNVSVSQKADYQCSSAMAALKNLKSTDEGKLVLSKLSQQSPKGVAEAIVQIYRKMMPLKTRRYNQTDS